MPIFGLILLAGGIIFIIASRIHPAAAIIGNAMQNEVTNSLGAPVPYQDLFEQVGQEKGVDWKLLAAHAFAESSYNPKALNHEGNKYGKGGSYGLMQILVTVDFYGIISNRLNVPEWSDVKQPEDLFDPLLNIRIGAGIIAENVSRYSLPRAIAVYNRYAERSSPQYGPFQNQSYVDRVLRKYHALGGNAI